MTIALATRRLELDPPLAPPHPARRDRRVLKRTLVATACSLAALIALVAAYVGYSLYKIDHAVHHVPVPASLLAKGKDDLLAIVKGPDHSEQIFVFHDAGGHTNVLKIPDTLGLPVASGATVPISKLSVHSPTAIVAGLTRLGIPVSRYAAVDLHTVDPASNLGRLATGKMSVSSLLTDPTGASSLLQQVASHVWLGPGTPVSAVLTLMNVPTAHPVSVPTEPGRLGHRGAGIRVRLRPAGFPVGADGSMGGIRAWWKRVRGIQRSDDTADAGTVGGRVTEPAGTAHSGGSPRSAPPIDERTAAQASLDQLLRQAADRRLPSGEEPPSG